MWHVGIDVHLRRSTVCVLDEQGRVVQRTTIRGPWPELVAWLEELESPFQVCFEASCGYGPLHDGLSRRAERVVVAHPGHLRLIFRSHRKNDRLDAERLAKLLYLGEVPAVHVPSPAIRAWRGTAGHRARLVARRTRAKNGMRALLRQCGIACEDRPWSQRGRRHLRELEFPTASEALRRDMLLEEVELADMQIKRVQAHLDQIAQEHPGVALLRTIPGVGARTAEAVLAFIDDPRRFTGSKTIGSYFGLVPRQDASGAVNRLGHITRRGPGLVRFLLTEAAWHGIRRSPRIRGYFERVQRGDPERKKIALVATAHYLARVMQAMLRTGEAWREERSVSV
jgi:transposase